MDRYIQAVVTTADHVKVLRRSDKTIMLSFDEWNVWYLERELKGEGLSRSEDIAGPGWPVAPRAWKTSTRSRTPSWSATC